MIFKSRRLKKCSHTKLLFGWETFTLFKVLQTSKYQYSKKNRYHYNSSEDVTINSDLELDYNLGNPIMTYS